MVVKRAGKTRFGYNKIVKARKNHECSKCGKDIPKGENYYRIHIKREFVDFPEHDYYSRPVCLECYKN